jgi:hypothetical protein
LTADTRKTKLDVPLTGLLRILQVTELRQMILEKLWPNVDDINSLSSTCKLAAAFIEKSIVCCSLTELPVLMPSADTTV